MRLVPVLALAVLAGTASSQPTPTVLGPGVISTAEIEYGPGFSPSGDTLYFTRRASFRVAPRILFSVRSGESWSDPSPVPFGHEAGDEFPYVTPDGSRIYFSSARPAPGRAENGRNDLWMVERRDGTWSEAVHLGGELSTDDIDSHPVVTPEGLYFHSRRSDGGGSVNAYFAAGRPDEWESPVLLSFNSGATDGEVAPRPAGGGAVFHSDREGGVGAGDLYWAPGSGRQWGAPVNLAGEINTNDWEWSPSWSPDGRLLVFGRLTADFGRSDLYTVTFRVPQ